MRPGSAGRRSGARRGAGPSNGCAARPLSSPKARRHNGARRGTPLADWRADEMQSLIQGFRLSPQQEHLCRIRRPGQEAGWGVLGLIEIDEIDGALDLVRLRLALEKVIARHEILCTTYPLLPGMNLPLQVVSEVTSGYTWIEHDLSGLAAPDHEAVLQKLAEDAREIPFDLTGGPLLRAVLARVERQRLFLLLSLPALAADSASLRNLAGEIAAAYSED